VVISHVGEEAGEVAARLLADWRALGPRTTLSAGVAR
jgi:hypothetical protein